MDKSPDKKIKTNHEDFSFDSLSVFCASVFNATNDMIATISIDEKVLFINRAGKKLLGISMDHDLLNSPLHVSDFHSFEVYCFLRSHVFPKVINKGECWKGEVEFKSLSNFIISLSLYVVPHFNHHGKVTWLTGIARDNSDKNALEIQQRLAKRVFDNTVEGIFVTDAFSRILQVNRAFCEITGYSALEVIGNTPRILQSKHHDTKFYESLWKQVNSLGSWQGEIWNRRKDGSVYLQWLSINCLKNNQDEIEYFVAVFHDLSELRARDAQIEYLVNHDPLTKLGNENQLIDKVKYSIQRSSIFYNNRLAVIKIDLGEIQLVNDSFGYAFCDKLIQEAAYRLNEIVSDQYLLVRLVADEFAVLVNGFLHAIDVSRLVFDIKSSLKIPFKIDDEILYMNPSIGIALYPDDANNAEDLMRFSRIALQKAKSDGRNTFCFYDPNMSQQARERLLLEQALREAVQSNSLTLNFQPKVYLDSGKVFAAEVLVRWNHPSKGNISPVIFIPLAERCGLISELDNWVMKETCRYLAEIKASGLPLVPLAINLSVNELESNTFSRRLINHAIQYDLDTSLFEFEVTETGLISREEIVIESLKQLRKAGFRVALDDFGTGYSSLSYLRKLPLSTLKIDRSFVNDLSEDTVSASIVRTVIELAKNLSLDVIAEGVETKGQQAKLLELGCTKAQGYLFYEPLNGDQFKELLKTLKV